MEIKHQVFVSSTYLDLVEERQQVIHALLELDCIPAGMELFPATDEDAWTLIKEVIDNCDYYILIIAGKYGSMNGKGVSYTEMEFDYAILTNKPIICFVHQNIEELPSIKTEKTESSQKKLLDFKTKAQTKHCKYWNSPEDLGGKVSRSMVQLKKRHPSDGWIPGKFAADEKFFRTIEDLRNKIEELEKEKFLSFETALVQHSELAQGDDVIAMKFSLRKIEKGPLLETIIEVSWDRIFSYVGTIMIGECTESEFLEKIRLVCWHSLDPKIIGFNDYSQIGIRHVYFDVIKVQLQALGLIIKGNKKRAVADKNTYWNITPFGEQYLIKVRAIRKTL
ncbi:DUF4062 domain-containing protein [Flavobacterium sp. A45]|uniref:DUF4062 domain-containing protein n=1 Tax=Flavobacterium sp. A45 TaxID=1945862 RepID=UPI000987C83F|nr:DUF4062 domain-containing protein [Flavobacterium sp. A45]OOG77791.1 hypothetical protein B0E44_02000 [Flavobacterium sp. A45]